MFLALPRFQAMLTAEKKVAYIYVNVSAERYKKVFVFTFELKSSKYKDDSTLDYGVLGTLIGSQHFGSFFRSFDRFASYISSPL